MIVIQNGKFIKHSSKKVVYRMFTDFERGPWEVFQDTLQYFGWNPWRGKNEPCPMCTFEEEPPRKCSVRNCANTITDGFRQLQLMHCNHLCIECYKFKYG